ncbi:hypothetical protein HK104_000359, partial [Borealophlyctis nickersoniae]
MSDTLNHITRVLGSSLDPANIYYTAATTATVIAVATGMMTVFRPKSPKPFETSKFPRDTVIVHHFGVDTEHVLPSSSPFVLKLLTYLRLTHTPHIVNITTDFSGAPKGKIPFISYNDTVMGDSSFIIDYLVKNGIVKTNPDEGLSPLQVAQATAVKALVEDSLYFIVVYCRWTEDFEKYIGPTFFNQIPHPLQFFIKRSFKQKHATLLHAQGLGRHTRAEIFVLWSKGIDALDTILGTQQFFMGSTPTMIDASVWGLLYSVMAIREVMPEFRAYVMVKRNL